MQFLNLFAVLCLVCKSKARKIQARSVDAGIGIVSKRQGVPPTYQAHIIEQPIDHFPNISRYAPHTEATFRQRYFFDSTYYKPGGPVFLYIGGETSGESRFSNLQTGIIQILMQATNGLGVILENRYYGESWPTNSSTTDDLRFLTTEQTIADNEFFATHATFPGVAENASLNAPETPWIMYGGSLAGGQVAFSLKVYNELFAGGIASSAAVSAKVEYPNWYNPILRYGPSDCVSRIVGIINKVDEVIDSGDETAIHDLKDVFGLADLHDIKDFAQAISYPLGGPFDYPNPTWQELNWNPFNDAQEFFHFCSNITNPNPPNTTLKIDNSLAKYTGGEPWTGLGNYANYFRKYLIPLCTTGRIDSTDKGCYGTTNATSWSDPTNSQDRSYLYTSCAELGAYIAAPKTGPSLISRVLDASYMQSWCNQSFPAGKYNAIPSSPDIWQINKYGGADIEAPRLALIDGEADVWVDVTYHSHEKGLRISSDEHPSYLIAGAGHHWDSYGATDGAREPDFIREAHAWEIRVVRRWIQEWKT
ncbi:hypothetical protein DM02DRAFT_698935 [Periconia macrospinosa]|uniref:Extracelular serine carboxypeptidase-like protein n=1 Tax=Periconia macrospinosa TaxID=97972 RepID=A0A2V1E0G3_9PLEO|nr:hypothetical protein DM02DRAFT_698935 [Periconia macrospinosa]